MTLELNHNLETELGTNRNALSLQYCPQCGLPMKEVDRVNENGSVYIYGMTVGAVTAWADGLESSDKMFNKPTIV